MRADQSPARYAHDRIRTPPDYARCVIAAWLARGNDQQTEQTSRALPVEIVAFEGSSTIWPLLHRSRQRAQATAQRGMESDASRTPRQPIDLIFKRQQEALRHQLELS